MIDNGKIAIMIWPDNSWCKANKLKIKLKQGYNRNYTTIYVAEDLFFSDIEEIVLNRFELIKEANNA